MMNPTTNQSGDDGVVYCVAGVVALIIGLFVLGILLAPLGVYLGYRGAKQGAATFGGVVIVAGLIETVVTVFGILALLAS